LLPSLSPVEETSDSVHPYFDFASRQAWQGSIHPCYQCNPWSILFRRERSHDFFEARIVAQQNILIWESNELFQLD